MTRRSALCPNCGAAIEFLWSGAVQTTCGACRSILVRHDLDLAKVGEVGEMPSTTTPIQIGTEGRYKGMPFVVVGRIIYEHERGHWNEWHIRLQDDTSAWLGDAMLEYTVTRAARPGLELPSFDDIRIGEAFVHEGTRFTVASVTHARYAAVEGELPFEYWDKSECAFVDLRARSDHFATIDYSEQPPLLFTGEYETFAQLQLTNVRSPEDIAGVAGKVRGFNCGTCGAAIELYAGDLTRTVACPACASVIDAKDEQFHVLDSYTKKTAVRKPIIPLGSEGMFDGVPWRVIGFQVRSIAVEGVEYEWAEYLLFNLHHGFRYLTEYDGHWNDVKTVQATPVEVTKGDQPVMELGGKQYKHFQSAVARTRFILGEFPWQVRRDDTASVADFVAPPLMLSREDVLDETTWSLGTYTAPEKIWSAFKLKGPPPRPAGVYANQPNPNAGIGRAYLGIYGIFAAVLIAMLLVRLFGLRGGTAYEGSFSFDRWQGDTNAVVTPVFSLPGRTSNVEISVLTPISNNWAYLEMSLIDTLTGRTFEVGREISKYSGVDGGEAWSEGSPNDRVVIGRVPAGHYYLRIGPDASPTLQSFSYVVRVTRDVPRVSYYLIAFLLLTLPLVFALLMSHSFETRRWAESDHAPVASDDDDE